MSCVQKRMLYRGVSLSDFYAVAEISSVCGRAKDKLWLVPGEWN